MFPFNNDDRSIVNGHIKYNILSCVFRGQYLVAYFCNLGIFLVLPSLDWFDWDILIFSDQ